MIADLKSYPEYKDSELPWLGAMPSHWQLRRMKFLFAERVQKGFPDEPLLAATQTKGVVRKEDYGARTVTAQKDFHLLKLVESGDFVISLRSFEGGIEVSHCRGIISPAYTILAPRPETHHSYFTHFFKSPDFIRSLTLFVTGIREGQNIDYERLSRAYLPLPTTEDQEVIGRFLDYANRRLERTIRAKRKVIALLNEQKQAIIHRAVTRGLDPHVPLKPSGIPWLGEIPTHWEVRRLKTLAQFVTSGSRGWARYYADSGAIFLRIGNISTTSVDLKLNRITHVLPPIDAEGERTKVQEDDVLLSITAQIGAVGIVPSGLGEAYVNQHTALIRLKPAECRPRWIAYCLLSAFGKRQCQLLTNGGTKVGLTLDDVRALRVFTPPEDEQRAILLQIEVRTRDLDIAITRTEREIALLREYRTRLIADVVTGKLDVREAARHLPIEADEPEALIEADQLDEGEESFDGDVEMIAGDAEDDRE
jgi:type I restriction enzyme, S subunit